MNTRVAMVYNKKNPTYILNQIIDNTINFSIINKLIPPQMNQQVEWAYLAEGNLHIILRYVGSDPKLKDKVLRLTKKVPEQKIQSHNNQEYFQSLMEEKVFPNLTSYLSVFEDYKFSDQESQLLYSNTIAEQIEPSRPTSRTKRQVDHNAPIQIGLNLFHSYDDIQGNICTRFGFEIKPKSHLRLMTLKNVSNVQKFKLVQQQKQLSGKGTHTQYDPQQLYRGDTLKAIKNLLEIPSNNFKLFQHNHEVKHPFTIDAQTEIDLSKVILTCLENDQPSVLNLIEQMFSKKTVDVEQTLEFLNELSSFTEEQIKFAVDHLDEDFQDQTLQKIQNIFNFLLMITWSDVSLIGNVIVFNDQPDLEKLPHHFRLAGNIAYRIKIVDYDLKPLQKIQDYKNQADQLMNLI